MKLDIAHGKVTLIPHSDLQYELKQSQRQPNDSSLDLQHDDDGAQEVRSQP